MVAPGTLLMLNVLNKMLAGIVPADGPRPRYLSRVTEEYFRALPFKNSNGYLFISFGCQRVRYVVIHLFAGLAVGHDNVRQFLWFSDHAIKWNVNKGYKVSWWAPVSMAICSVWSILSWFVRAWQNQVNIEIVKIQLFQLVNGPVDIRNRVFTAKKIQVFGLKSCTPRLIRLRPVQPLRLLISVGVVSMATLCSVHNWRKRSMAGIRWLFNNVGVPPPTYSDWISFPLRHPVCIQFPNRNLRKTRLAVRSIVL